jgi:transketolase
MDIQNFKLLLTNTKIRLLKLHYDSKVGHIGGNFSCIDALMTLHHLVMNPKDRFILSKGHSAAALYVTLNSLGLISEDELITFSKDDSRLPGHPSGIGIPGLLFPTGSLGHGPSLSAGLALAARYSKTGHHVYCLCSDGEWQEGSCWESLIFSVHNKLKNLTIVIDQNGLQGFGRTKDIVSIDDLSSRFKAFGAYVQKIDGHNIENIRDALLRKSDLTLNVIVLNTIKGKSLPFQDTLASHYLPISSTDYALGIKSIINEMKL